MKKLYQFVSLAVLASSLALFSTVTLADQLQARECGGDNCYLGGSGDGGSKIGETHTGSALNINNSKTDDNNTTNTSINKPSNGSILVQDSDYATTVGDVSQKNAASLSDNHKFSGSYDTITSDIIGTDGAQTATGTTASNSGGRGVAVSTLGAMNTSAQSGGANSAVASVGSSSSIGNQGGVTGNNYANSMVTSNTPTSVVVPTATTIK